MCSCRVGSRVLVAGPDRRLAANDRFEHAGRMSSRHLYRDATLRNDEHTRRIRSTRANDDGLALFITREVRSERGVHVGMPAARDRFDDGVRRLRRRTGLGGHRVSVSRSVSQSVKQLSALSFQLMRS